MMWPCILCLYILLVLLCNFLCSGLKRVFGLVPRFLMYWYLVTLLIPMPSFHGTQQLVPSCIQPSTSSPVCRVHLCALWVFPEAVCPLEVGACGPSVGERREPEVVCHAVSWACFLSSQGGASSQLPVQPFALLRGCFALAFVFSAGLCVPARVSALQLPSAALQRWVCLASCTVL